MLPALTEAWQRATIERVEIGCTGGRGRTGTALACLAVLDGIPSAAAVAFVRERYDRHAVETPGQRRYVARWPVVPAAAITITSGGQGLTAQRRAASSTSLGRKDQREYAASVLSQRPRRLDDQAAAVHLLERPVGLQKRLAGDLGDQVL